MRSTKYDLVVHISINLIIYKDEMTIFVPVAQCQNTLSRVGVK